MSNSSLICYTKISPHRNSPRNNKIRKITIHHMAGNISIETCGNVFQSRQASSNYGIGSDGRIAMYVEEKDRSWASSSPSNDHQAVTIEVANDVIGGNWHVSDKALESLVNLCTDICQRNGIERLNFTGDKTGNLTMHRYFAATNCPGPYLESKFPWIAEQVNKRLSGEASASTPVSPPSTSTPAKDELYRIRKSWADAKSQIGAYSNLSGAKSTCDKAGEGYHVFNSAGKIVYSASASAIDILAKNGIIDTSEYWETAQNQLKYLDKLLSNIAKVSGASVVTSVNTVNDALDHLAKCGVIDTPDYWKNNYSKIKYLDKLLISAAKHIKANTFTSYKVKVTTDALNIRSGAGTNHGIVGVIRDEGVYTIVEEKNGWGKLKSGAGWISLQYTEKV